MIKWLLLTLGIALSLSCYAQNYSYAYIQKQYDYGHPQQALKLLHRTEPGENADTTALKSILKAQILRQMGRFSESIATLEQLQNKTPENNTELHALILT